MDMESEQTSEQTFRVTSTQEGRVGVAVFVQGKPSVVLWLGTESHRAAERLALHLETQVDRVSPSPLASGSRPQRTADASRGARTALTRSTD